MNFCQRKKNHRLHSVAKEMHKLYAVDGALLETVHGEPKFLDCGFFPSDEDDPEL